MIIGYARISTEHQSLLQTQGTSCDLGCSIMQPTL